jgi:hypothetical protein
MKYLKLVLKFFVCFIIFILSILVIDYIRINVSYSINKNKYIETFDVQGNTNKYIPQGLAYSSLYDVILQTSYNKEHDVSMLYITDFKSGKLLKSLKLIDINDKDNMKHVGGITTDNKTVWITNDYEVDEFSLSEIINTDLDYIKSLRNTKLPNRGDFCLYNDGTLYIGDFYLKPFYDVPDGNPLLMAYDVSNLDYSNPSYIVSLPKMVQGMEIVGDKYIFSQSFTYLINSSLSIYNKPISNGYYTLNGKDIPYYKLELDSKYKLPPMVEGIFYKDNYLYMLFESGSDGYSLALPKIKKVLKKEIDI